MSADDGIYILVSPKQTSNGFTGTNEYRVAHCTAIENIDIGFNRVVKDECGVSYPFWALYEAIYFDDSKIYESKLEALVAAAFLEEELSKQRGVETEYGIKTICRKQPFPSLSRVEAQRMRDKYQ